MRGRQQSNRKAAVDALNKLGARWTPSLDAYASGRIGVRQIICVLCGKAPCMCRPCPKCKWHGAPDKPCQACG
jgi:hypothetical protein